MSHLRELERKNTALREIEKRLRKQEFLSALKLTRQALTDPEPADQPSDSREGE